MKKQDFAATATRLRRTVDGEFDLIKVKPKARGKLDRFTSAPVVRDIGVSESVVILGGGVSGLTLAYELLKLKGQFKVTILEAANRVGGRSLTLRPGDSFTEDINTPKGVKQVTQTCNFKTESKPTPYSPYLNAGPGRIPSQHRDLLDLCKEINVDLEVYVMESRSNHFFAKDAFQNKPQINRRIANDTRGYVAIDLYNRILAEPVPTDPKAKAERDQYLSLLRNFGALVTDDNGNVVYEGSQRIGYTVQPGLGPGEEEVPLNKAELLESEFWLHRFYQPEDFEWQTTLFQPVGGMDMIEKALEAKVKAMGGKILLNSKVTKVEKLDDHSFRVTYQGPSGEKLIGARYCASNVPLPLLNGVVQPNGFDPKFWKDFNEVVTNDQFLRPACKVGWQAKRKLWQDPENENEVPIFGGISYTTHPMTQMWYPSSRIHDEYGVLTGTYNYEENAATWGKLMPDERLKLAREGAAQLHSPAFAAGLESGLTIAWQNIPTQGGGWVDWQYVSTNVKEQARIMNTIRLGDGGFHIIGDQVSFLPGWKEGAVVSALEAFALISKVHGFVMPTILRAPNTARLTQGYVY